MCDMTYLSIAKAKQDQLQICGIKKNSAEEK